MQAPKGVKERVKSPYSEYSIKVKYTHMYNTDLCAAHRFIRTQHTRVNSDLAVCI